jgi:CRISPR-associated protein Csm2
MRETIRLGRDTIEGDQIQRAIEKGGNEIVKIAEPIGKYLASDLEKKERLTRSQIRNIFAIAKKMQMKGTKWEDFDWNEFILLKPKIAYMTKKTGSNKGSKILGKILLEAVDATFQSHEKHNFKNFMNFFEAILAYHVRYGGK